MKNREIFKTMKRQWNIFDAPYLPFCGITLNIQWLSKFCDKNALAMFQIFTHLINISLTTKVHDFISCDLLPLDFHTKNILVVSERSVKISLRK